MANQISSDSGSSAGSFLSLTSTLYDEESVHMLNKGVQAGKAFEFKFCIDIKMLLQHTYLTSLMIKSVKIKSTCIFRYCFCLLIAENPSL